MNYWDIFINGYTGYANYLWSEITNPGWHNYFYWLLLASGFFFFLEIVTPWRKNQKKFRKDFWLDFFYMFFNFFLFSLIIYNAASDFFVHLFNNIIYSITSFDLQASNPMRNWPFWAILLTGFVIRDFIQWWTHRLLHRVEFLWQYHKVHHSVEEMGFAAQLRYHWMENIVYRTIEYIPLALMGIGLYDFFIIHIIALAVGHYNHSNFRVSGFVTGAVVGCGIGIIVANNLLDVSLISDPSFIQKAGIIFGCGLGSSIILGPFMKIIFNSPEMHIWHHSYDLPEDRRYGINFGLTLAIWDYIFKTAYIPFSGRDIRLGFPNIENFPKTFLTQNIYGFGFNKKVKNKTE